jgi:hypothetical protein
MLAGERPGLDAAQRQSLIEVGAFTFVDRTWVTLWFDPDHAVRSDCGGMTAYRAITTTGDLLWYVAPAGEAPVYHAQCADPYEAIEHATVALGAQDDLNRRWVHIERLAHDLRRGAIHFNVTLDDARMAPICPLGFKAVMASVGLFGARAISGRTAAVLMKVEPNIGHIIHAAWMRAEAVPTARSTRAKTAPMGFESIC